MSELNWRSVNAINPSIMAADYVDSKINKGDTWTHNIVNNTAPMFKALTIIMIYIVSNLGYSPVGCKTQYLFSNKFWYNKQLVIFFVIYFVINLRSNAAHGGAAPNDLFIMSIIVWLLYNITSRLGETWAIMQSPLWPGPLTWFGLLTFPLILLFIINDSRKYYISIDKTNVYDTTIKILYHVEIVLMVSILLLIGIGFIRSYQEQSKKWGKKFKFLQFFFGIEDNDNPATQCNSKTFRQYDREIRKATKTSVDIPVTLLSFLPELSLITFVILMITYMPNIMSTLTPLFEKPDQNKIKTSKSWKDASNNM